METNTCEIVLSMSLTKLACKKEQDFRPKLEASNILLVPKSKQS